MIKLFGIHFNRPDFVAIQYATLKAFVQDDFEYVVVNNANHPQIYDLIERESAALNIKTIRVAENINPQAAAQYPGYHHAYAMNSLIESEMRGSKDICVILDGDAFLLRSYSFEDRMRDHQLLGSLQQRKGRYWLTPVVLGMKPSELQDFHEINLIGSHICNLTPSDYSKDVGFYPKKVGNEYLFDCPHCSGQVFLDEESHVPLDTGGQLYAYLKSHDNVRVKKIPTTSHITEDCIEWFPELVKLGYEPDFRFEIYDNSFLHYCRSSNWDGRDRDFHERKTTLLVNVVKQAMSGVDFTSARYELPSNDWNSWPPHALKNHSVE